MGAQPQESEASSQAMSQEQLLAEIERLRPLAEMGRMSATVAHEIRNPLAGISANAELLREVVSSGPDCESVDIILSEVERLGHLVSDLLYYSREREPELGPIELPWLARSTIDLSMSEAERAGVEIRVSGRGRAVGDADLSRQALLNVIRNAVQACRVGGCVTVTVSEGQIAVSDTGSGVPEILKERLFEPFITGRTRGLGLGATVARRCLRRQNGDLRLVESSPGGSRFALIWPKS
jgi:signal transduction histidine kinase